MHMGVLTKLTSQRTEICRHSRVMCHFIFAWLLIRDSAICQRLGVDVLISSCTDNRRHVHRSPLRTASFSRSGHAKNLLLARLHITMRPDWFSTCFVELFPHSEILPHLRRLAVLCRQERQPSAALKCRCGRHETYYESWMRWQTY